MTTRLVSAEIIQAIEKLQKRCIIKFTNSHMHIICNHDASEGGVQVWSYVAYRPIQTTRDDAYDSRQVKVQSLFSDYRIQSNANNEITFLISPEALLLALRSAWNPTSLDSTPETVMKLAKKNDQAVLSFDISGSMSSGRSVRVGHDVRIEVMKPSDVNRLTEPMCPEPDVRNLAVPFLFKRLTERQMVYTGTGPHFAAPFTEAAHDSRTSPAALRHHSGSM